MAKDNLIFDWSESENHRGRYLVAFLLVCLLAVAIGSVVEIRFSGGKARIASSASVMYFADDEIGNYWRMKAEEDGPFPGGMRISGADDLVDFHDYAAWNDHEILMRSLETENAAQTLGIVERGTRYFPDRSGVIKEELPENRVDKVQLSPVISPYEKEAMAWLPEHLPVFKGETVGDASSSGWRFILQLRADGSVAYCLPMSGGEAELSAIILWLEGIRFEKSDEEMRWMAVRVEFLNSTGNDSDSE